MGIYATGQNFPQEREEDNEDVRVFLSPDLVPLFFSLFFFAKLQQAVQITLTTPSF